MHFHSNTSLLKSHAKRDETQIVSITLLLKIQSNNKNTAFFYYQFVTEYLFVYWKTKFHFNLTYCNKQIKCGKQIAGD